MAGWFEIFIDLKLVFSFLPVELRRTENLTCVHQAQTISKPALITRFAPTPSGYLHIGNVYSFLLTWLIARKNTGKILLRIDDLDQERVRREYVDNIFRVLDWLELGWDLGPKTPEEFYKEYSQLSRMGLYSEKLTDLQKEGLVFACRCTRKMLRETGAGPAYPGNCKGAGISLDSPDVSWRLDTAEPLRLSFREFAQGEKTDVLPNAQHFFVVKRKDGVPAYHLASLVDDMHFGVNFIVRGQDLYESTLSQLYLAAKAGAAGFAKSTFFHHPLIFEKQAKLSKSQNASPVLTEFYPDKARLFIKLGSWLGLEPDESDSLEAIFKNADTGSFAKIAALLK